MRKYRREELVNLRGNGKGELKEWDRVYDYAFYNDLGNPDKGPEYARPVLGGSQEYPYPRRGRTGRKPTKTGRELNSECSVTYLNGTKNIEYKQWQVSISISERFILFHLQSVNFSFLIETDPNSERRLPLISLDIYVPRDERFGHLKFSDFLAYALKSLVQILLPEITSLCDKTINEFDSFDDVLNLYEGGIKLPNSQTVSKIRDRIPWEMLKELVRNDGERFLKFPMPDVIKGTIYYCFCTIFLIA